MGQPASKLGPQSACQQNVIRMAFQWRADNGPIVRVAGCRSVLNPTCIYSSILAMFFSGVRFVSVNV